MKKIGFIILAVVLTLGIIGVGYALWTQPLAVKANLSTGNLAATIDVSSTLTALDSAGGSVSSYATIAKDINTTSTDLVVDIANAAPGDVFTVPWIITNTGTIPVNIAAPTANVAVVGQTGAITDLVVNGTAAMTAINLPAVTLNTISGSLTITVADNAPNVAGGCSYTVSVPMTVTQGS